MDKTCWIQVDDDAPFKPDVIHEIGIVFGKQEKTKPEHPVRGYALYSQYSVIHYTLNGLETEAYYRIGTWKAASNDEPLFHVKELLTG